MPDSDPPAEEDLAELLAKVTAERDRYRADVGRHLVMQQKLALAKGQVDEELRRFDAIQRFISAALAVPVDDSETFVTLALEAAIEAFELEVALLLYVGEDEGSFRVGGEFGFEEPPEDVSADTAAIGSDAARVLRSDDDPTGLLAALALDQAVVCAFENRDGRLSGLLLTGLTSDGAEYFDPVGDDTCPAFTVMARQVGSIWLAREMQREILAHNARLAALTESYSRFVPFEFLRLLARASIEDVSAGDCVAVDLTVLFLDIRGYTTLAERFGPQGTYEALNRLLAELEPAITDNDGFINQYMGDAIMALFPGPSDGAVRCAVEIFTRARPFNDARVAEGLPALDFGLGVHSGSLMLGAIGGGKRLDSGVIGDAANLASRVEGLTRKYGSSALTTGETLARLADPTAFEFREVDRVLAKGRATPVALFELLDCDAKATRADKESTRVDFAAGLAAYLDGEFAAAAERFAACVDATAGDPAATLLRERCDELAASPPDDWTGTWRWTTK